MQLLLKEFFSWVDTKGSSPLLTPVWDQLKTILGELEQAEKFDLTEHVQTLNKDVSDHLLPRLTDFRELGCARSATFQLWMMYLDTIQILLRNIRAEREGDWCLHLSTVLDMAPYLFATD